MITVKDLLKSLGTIIGVLIIGGVMGAVVGAICRLLGVDPGPMP